MVDPFVGHPVEVTPATSTHSRPVRMDGGDGLAVERIESDTTEHTESVGSSDGSPFRSPHVVT